MPVSSSGYVSIGQPLDPDPAPDPGIAGAEQAIAMQLTDVEATVARLETRLARLLRPEEATVGMASDLKVVRTSSEHVEDLRGHARFIAALNDRLLTLLERLDA